MINAKMERVISYNKQRGGSTWDYAGGEERSRKTLRGSVTGINT